MTPVAGANIELMAFVLDQTNNRLMTLCNLLAIMELMKYKNEGCSIRMAVV